jgi:hypothetical protein
MTDEKPKTQWALHIYEQEHEHNSAQIIGTRNALAALQAAIGEALRDKCSEADFFATDGEGYSVWVVQATDAEMRTLPVPYAEYSFEADDKWEPLRNLVFEALQKMRVAKAIAEEARGTK